MNNNQFRRLVLANPESQNGNAPNATTSAATLTLGTKKSSFMPMTPRTVKGGIDVDFARQVRERNAAQQPTKKFKSATPKGVKFGAGYTDRARARAEAEAGEEADGKASRIKALEEQMKLDQISVEIFEALRDGITGGDVASTHLVKGLDRKLLERVRRGEDVLGSSGDKSGVEAPPDVDEELDKLGDQEVETIQKEEVKKKGIMAPPPVAGVKRSRDEIMAELKAQRKAVAAAKAAPALDTSRWRKVGEKQKSRIEIDHKGREVLVTVDEDGVVKRKVRKVPVRSREEVKAAIEMPQASKPVLGADADMPFQQKPPIEVDEDDDIFAGVGTEYNPLGEENEDSDDNNEEPPGDKIEKSAAKTQPSVKAAEEAEDHAIEANQTKTASAARNYFKDTSSVADEPIEDRLAGVQHLLMKAAKMDSLQDYTNGVPEDDARSSAARLKKRAEMLALQDRDLEDMDMTFGSSRYDDNEDEGEGKKVRLSEWKGSAADDDGGWEVKEKAGGKKKRKPKKRKGDADSMADIMSVIDGRKSAGGK